MSPNLMSVCPRLRQKEMSLSFIRCKMELISNPEPEAPIPLNMAVKLFCLLLHLSTDLIERWLYNWRGFLKVVMEVIFQDMISRSRGKALLGSGGMMESKSSPSGGWVNLAEDGEEQEFKSATNVQDPFKSGGHLSASSRCNPEGPSSPGDLMRPQSEGPTSSPKREPWKDDDPNQHPESPFIPQQNTNPVGSSSKHLGNTRHYGGGLWCTAEGQCHLKALGRCSEAVGDGRECHQADPEKGVDLGDRSQPALESPSGSEDDRGSLGYCGDLEDGSQQGLESSYIPKVDKGCFEIHMDFRNSFQTFLEGPSISKDLDECLENREDFQDEAQQHFKGPALSQEDGRYFGHSGNFNDVKEPHSEGLSAAKENGECLEGGMVGGNFKEPAGTLTCFENPLVKSLFFCPSDEIEDVSQSESDSDWSELEEEEDGAEGQEEDKIWESFFQTRDPFNLLCFSKPTGQHKTPAPNQTRPKDIKVSFYLNKAPRPCSPPRKPRSQQCLSATYSPHHCQLSLKAMDGTLKAETSTSAQEGNRAIRKVRFSPVVTVRPLVVWGFASRAARRGPWEEMARDRSRFRQRIAKAEAILRPCLEPGHRAEIWERIYGDASIQGVEPRNVRISRSSHEPAGNPGVQGEASESVGLFPSNDGAAGTSGNRVES
uniref:Protein phosphatase 1 regulatory subunit 15A n=1 Tax=Sphenodon punctatus TaxID=8508 RepID=A0A8D0H638_SPHPU